MGYIKQLEISGTTYDIKAKQAINDSDGNEISSTYVKKSGDTMTGNLNITNGTKTTTLTGAQLQADTTSCSWSQIKENAIISTTASGISKAGEMRPLIAAQGYDYVWCLATYYDSFYIIPMSNTNISNGTNQPAKNYRLEISDSSDSNVNSHYSIRNFGHGTATPTNGQNGDMYLWHN